ncbi:MAG TPA: DNA-3-methyladenine glycosylase I [Caulobacteraceae bacterium]|jgi:3-methyladenine DNA glycosylase Tag|nr:DNA-3-methyladenine glycosylase I [Caulobacteraceae bacterium]
MQCFEAIYERAAARKGGAAALEAMIGEYPPKSRAELAAIPDHRWLAEMSRSVFQAGFNWSVIDNKWPGFEAAFHGFDPALNAAMSDEEFDAHLKDARIVRNGQKVASVRANGQFLVDLAREHGSAARFFADWPDADLVGLLEVMKQRAARCAGETAMRLFRRMGKPAFITTRDVAAALVEAGVLAAPPKNRKDLQAVQAAFNAWSVATGRDFNAISRVLALSAGPSYEPGAPPWPR